MHKFVITILFFMLTLIGCGPKSQGLHQFQSAQGETITLENFKGRWLVVNYWASWCHPCVEEIKAFNAFAQKHQADNIDVLGINIESLSQNDLKQLATEFAMTYPTLYEDVGAYWGIPELAGVPSTFIIDPNGKIVAKLEGPQTLASLESALKAKQPHVG